MKTQSRGHARCRVLLLLTIALAMTQASRSWADENLDPEASKSTPKDMTPYTRSPVAEDYGFGLVPPPILLVDPIVSNTNPNLNNTDTANDGEASIAVNPSNPDEIIIASFRGGWGANAPILHSLDGGLTWTEQFTIPAPPGQPGALGCPCDQTFDYGQANDLSGVFLAGELYTGTTTNPANAGSWNWFAPGGVTQASNIGALGNPDQPWLIVNRDPFAASQDNVYVGYDDFDGAPDMRVTVSYGANPPNFTVDNVVGFSTSGVNPGHRMAEDPSTGFIYSVWQQCTSGCGSDGVKGINYMLNRSTDGGATWGLNGNPTGIIVVNANSTQARPKFGTVNALLGGVTSVATDPTTGDVYYVYGNQDGVTGNDRLSIIRLTDDNAGGLNIGSSNFVTGQVEAALPVVAVAEDGTLAVFYYTFDGFASSGFPIFGAHLAFSDDHGANFETVTMLTFLSSAVDNGNNRQRVLGDYQDMQAVGRTFYGAFTANGISFGRPVANHDPIFFRAAVGPLILVNADLEFGDVCLGDTETRELQIFNSGTEALIVTSVAPVAGGSPDITVDNIPGVPASVAPGAHLSFTVRCTPTTLGSHAATIRIQSNDPDNPQVDLAATCNTPPGDIRVTGSTDFGDVCADEQAEKTVSICNVGLCNLNVTSVAFNPQCDDFTLVSNPFPAPVSHDFCVDVVIRFTPTSAGPKSCNLVIASDDPDQPTITLVVTANTPLASIDVPPDMAFPPTVIQSEGACSTLQEFPISNTGECNLTVTNIQIGGVDAGDYSLVGLPSFPVILEPGHIVGEGDLRIAFAPTELDRSRTATVTVTYESDPVSETTTDVTRVLCGEGVKTGARLLVLNSGAPLDVVKSIKIQRIVGNRQINHEVAKNAELQSVPANPPCEAFQYHREWGTVSNPVQLATGSYQVTAQSKVNGKMESRVAFFELATCDFNPQVVIDLGVAQVAGGTVPTADDVDELSSLTGDKNGTDQASASSILVEAAPLKTGLIGIDPNPFNPAATVSFDLARQDVVRLEVFNERGVMLRRLVDGNLGAGHHRVTWDGRDSSGRASATGVYFFRIVAGDVHETMKAVLMK